MHVIFPFGQEGHLQFGQNAFRFFDKISWYQFGIASHIFLFFNLSHIKQCYSQTNQSNFKCGLPLKS